MTGLFVFAVMVRVTAASGKKQRGSCECGKWKNSFDHSDLLVFVFMVTIAREGGFAN